MKSTPLYLTLAFIFFPLLIFATGQIYDASVILDVNGTVQYIPANSFDGYVFDNPTTLILKGGQTKTWKSDTTDIGQGWMFYRIYKCDASPGSFISIDIPWKSDDGTGSNGETYQTWLNDGESIDLLQNLQPGIYILEVYYSAPATDDNWANTYYLYYSNNSNNFKAKIIVYNQSQASGNWSDDATWLYGAPTGYQPVIIKAGHTINLDGRDSATILKLNGTLNCGSDTLVIGQACSSYSSLFSVNGTFNAEQGTVIFNDYTSVSGTITFKNVVLNAGVNFGTSSTIDSNLIINTGGYVDQNPVTYTGNSALIYKTSGSYNRYLEWVDNINSGAGFPNIVKITNNTTLNLNTTNPIYARGLYIENGSTLNMDATTQQPLIIYGDVTIDGQFNFSGEIGGDLKLTGDIIQTGNGKINWGGDGVTDFGRALFLVGQDTQHITNVDTIPFLLLDSAAYVILDNDVVINGNGTQFLTLAYDAVLDLNGKTLTSLASGNIDVDATNGQFQKKITGSPGSRIVFTGSTNCTVNPINGGTLLIDTNVTIAVEGGTIDFGLGATDLYGTVEIRGQASIANGNYPVYHSGSTLKYVNIEDVTTGGEWPAVGGPTNIWIASTDYKKVILNEDKTITGILTIQSGKIDTSTYSLSFDNGSTLKYLIPKDTVYYIADTCAQEWQKTSPQPYNVEIASGTVCIAANRTVSNILTVDSGAVLQVKDQTGQLTVTDTLFIENYGKLVLLSPQDSNATGSLITLDTIINNGSMVAQRFIYAKHYAYLTPPNLETNSSIFNINPGGTFNPNFYEYNESYDATPDPDQATYSEWSDPTNGFAYAWVSLVNQNLTTAAKGYAYYNDVPRLFEFDGTFLTGDQTITLSAHYNDANNGYFDGWNLIANPFVSALDWDSPDWDKTAIYDVVYYWDPNTGNYKYYSAAGTYDDGSNVVNGGSRYIPAMQGFFIKVKDGYDGTQFKIPASARVHNSQDFWTKKSQTKTSRYIKLSVNYSGKTDETVIRFIPEASLEFDDYDAYKRITSVENYPQIFTFRDTNLPELAINALPTESVDDTVNLGTAILSDNTSDWEISLVKTTIPLRHILLLDNQTQQIINLTVRNQAVLSKIRPGFSKDRFKIVFKANTAPYLHQHVQDLSLNQGDTLDLVINTDIFTDPDPGDSLNYSITCPDCPLWVNIDRENLKISGIATETGTFSVVVTATDFFKTSVSDTFQISVKALPTVTQSANTPEIYPNPANQILTVSNAQGAVVMIYNNSSVLVKKQTLTTNNELDVSSLQPGLYIIRLIVNGKIYTYKFVKL